MSKPQSCETCAIHCATATGFSKVDIISDFIFAGPFGSAFFLCHPERSPKGEVSLITWQLVALVGMIPEWGEGSIGFNNY